MDSNFQNNSEQKIINSANDLLDLKRLFKTIKRQRILIVSLTSIATIFSIFYSIFKVPTWKGEFQIVVEQSSDSSRNQPGSLNSIPGLSNFSFGSNTENKTQEAILSSPLVLESVYKFVKEYKNNNSENTYSLNFKEWRNNQLGIRFQEDTNVLDISFIDQDKELILKTLDMISDKYQEYSKRDRERSLNNGIKYLEIQESQIREKSNESIKKLNKFAIANGLGDIDGFVKLETNINNSSGDINNQIQDIVRGQMNSDDTISNTGAGQRYTTQFAMLEKLEAEYLNLSSKLKNNSKTLINLKSQIDKLSKSLERPNEILLEFRVLKRTASRYENMLKDIEARLLALKLEKVKKQSPWELITNPTLQDKRVSPKRKQIVLSTFLLSFIVSFLLAKFRDFNSNVIYELDYLKEKLIFRFIGNINKNNILLNDTFLNQYLSKEKINKINFIYINNDSFFNKDHTSLEKLFSDNSKINYLNSESMKNLENPSKIIVLAEAGKTNKKTLTNINEFLVLFKSYILGWVNINE